MANSKYDSLFYGIFFFIQGVIITFIVMLSVFNYKFVPVMQKKDHEIELLMERLMSGIRVKITLILEIEITKYNQTKLSLFN